MTDTKRLTIEEEALAWLARPRSSMTSDLSSLTEFIERIVAERVAHAARSTTGLRHENGGDMTDKGAHEIAEAIHCLANAIMAGARGGATGRDATGGTVGSLGEAVMGVTAALADIGSKLPA